MHGRIVRAGLRIRELEHPAVQSRAALAGAAVEGSYEPVALYPGFAVRLCLRSVRDVRALCPDDSPGAERVNSELLLEYHYSTTMTMMVRLILKSMKCFLYSILLS